MALFLPIIVRDIWVSRTLARHKMSDSKIPTRFAKVLISGAGLEKAALKPDVPRNAERIRGRHAAITNNFNNWRNYKEWAEKIRGAWDEKK
jgi:hypothetical protein